MHKLREKELGSGCETCHSASFGKKRPLRLKKQFVKEGSDKSNELAKDGADMDGEAMAAAKA